MKYNWLRRYVLLGLLFALFGGSVSAAPAAVLWEFWATDVTSDTRQIDHSEWTAFLSRFTVPDHPSGVTRVRYADVSPADENRLTAYIEHLEAVPIRSYNRDEQFAYWVNLYNAATVRLILDNYPVNSIRDIRSGGLFSAGPWDTPVLTVEQKEMTLNDIEHRILRPIWNDRRIHFVVNCASIGCPNLWPEALTAENAETILRESELAYLAHPRGVSVVQGRIDASSIFDWYGADFADSRENLVAYWHQYAPERAQAAIDSLGNRPRIRFAYDWELNEP